MYIQIIRKREVNELLNNQNNTVEQHRAGANYSGHIAWMQLSESVIADCAVSLTTSHYNFILKPYLQLWSRSSRNLMYNVNNHIFNAANDFISA